MKGRGSPAGFAAAIGFVAICIARESLAQSVVPSRVLAATGQLAPGTSARYGEVGTTTNMGLHHSGNGQILFHADLQDGTEGLWLANPQGVSLLFRSGMAAPGMPAGVTFTAFAGQRLNDSAQLTFMADVSGPGVDPANNTGIWSGTPANLNPVARPGNPSPGVPGAVWSFVSAAGDGTSIGLSPTGGVTFSSFLSPRSTPNFWERNGIWSGAPGELRPVAVSGMPAAGIGGQVRYRQVALRSLDGPDRVSFRASLEGPGVDATNDRGIWAGTADDLTLVARVGDAARGVQRQNYERLGAISLNARGRVAFTAHVTQSSTWSSGAGLWAGPPHAPELILRPGDPVPPAGIAFGATVQRVDGASINDLGQIAFTAHLSGRNLPSGGVDSIWLRSAEGSRLRLTPVAVQGRSAPGTNDGSVLKSTMQVYDFNNAGQILFNVGLETPGFEDRNYGLWVSDPQGRAQLVARSGMTVDFGDSVPHTLDLIMGASLSETGQVVYRALFTDETTAIMTAQTVILEPAALSLLTLSLLLARRHRSPSTTSTSLPPPPILNSARSG